MSLSSRRVSTFGTVLGRLGHFWSIGWVMGLLLELIAYWFTVVVSPVIVLPFKRLARPKAAA